MSNAAVYLNLPYLFMRLGGAPEKMEILNIDEVKFDGTHMHFLIAPTWPARAARHTHCNT
jgi:hypothetical protein